MKKSPVLVLSVIFAVLLFSACNKNGTGIKSENAPEIKVTAEDKNISWVLGLNKWDGSVYDRKDNFSVYFEKFTADDLVFLNRESVIQIEFDRRPDSFTLKDYVLRDNGELMFGNEMVQTVTEIDGEGNKISFTLGDNISEFLSSAIHEYFIRGFKLTCRWGEDECEYAFAVKKDSGFKISGQNTGAYMAVFEKLMKTDDALNADIKYIALDYEKAMTENKKDLEEAFSEYCTEHGYQLLIDDFEGLCESGYIEKDELYFKDGIIISFEDSELTEEKLVTDASKWRSGLGAVGAEYTVINKDGKWEIDQNGVQQEWIS